MVLLVILHNHLRITWFFCLDMYAHIPLKICTISHIYLLILFVCYQRFSLLFYLVSPNTLQTLEPAILPPLREIYPGNMIDDLTGAHLSWFFLKAYAAVFIMGHVQVFMYNKFLSRSMFRLYLQSPSLLQRCESCCRETYWGDMCSKYKQN